MSHIENHLRIFVLLGCVLCFTTTQAVSNDDLLSLEADMLEHIGTNERDSFLLISEKLKNASKEAGAERLFYKAWSKQAVYEATHQNFQRASEIEKDLTDYATNEQSIVGKYFSLHTQAFILQQQDDFEAAEKAYLQALDIRHKNFPKESAAEDLRELLKMAYQRNDYSKAKNYANRLLAEPNLTPHHRGRTLYRLSTIAFEENDVEEFNRIYDEMKRLMQTDGIRLLNFYTEVNYHIINGDYKQALRLADWLAVDTSAERKALIYHRLGDNEKAYEYMARYKHVSDSLTHVSHNNVVADLYLRMNNDRLRLERELLKHQNNQLLYRVYIGGAIIFILILLFLVYQRHRIVKLLRYDNTQLKHEKDAERALKDLNELSQYESKTEIPLDNVIKLNKLCNHMSSFAQNHCRKEVTCEFLTEFDDDFEMTTNSDALERLLTHLLNYSVRYTHQGVIKLKCEEAGANVRFSVTDTSLGLGNKPKNHVVGMFAEEEDTVRYVGMNFNICQSITRLLHGRIWHDVDNTNGTRFIFEIPKSPNT